MWWWGVLLFLCLMPALAHADPVHDDARARQMFTEVRCVVCQGESIADSEAPIAADMRAQIRADIARGMSDAQIRKTFYDRYGDYVLFRPRLSKLNLILWIVPPLIVVFGLIWLVVRAGKARKQRDYALTPQEREKLEAVLKE